MTNVRDLASILEALNKVTIEENFVNLKAQLDINKPLYLDTETTQLYASIKLVQLYQEHWNVPLVFDVRLNPNTSLKSLHTLIKDCFVVVHNISFDIACLMNDLELNVLPFKDFDDTLVLAKLALFHKLTSFSLDSCFELVTGFDVYDEVLNAYKHLHTSKKRITKSLMQKSFVKTKTKDTINEPASKLQIVYSALDVLLLPHLYKLCLKEMPANSDWVYELDKWFIKHTQVWQRRGIPVDKEIVARKEKNVKALLVEAQLALNSLAGSKVNVNSSFQVCKLLHLQSSSKLELKSLMLQGNEAARLVYECRRLIKQLNFLERYTTKSGRLRGYFAPLTASGRSMCSGDAVEGSDSDNIQQIPRNLKSVVGYSKDSPKYLVYADFAQLELRTACAEQGDEVLYNLFTQGKDLHKYAASQIYSIPESEVTPEQRVMAKFSNFCLLYLGSATMFRAVVTEMGDREPPTTEECERIVRVWRSIYPGIAAWHKRLKHQYINGNMINHTLGGRYYRANLYTDLAAIQNQGLGAEIAKLTIHYLFKKEPNVKLIHFIHDSFIIDADSFDEAKESAKLLADTMVEAWVAVTKSCKISNLPMPTTAEVVKHLDEEPLYIYTNEGF